MDKDFVTALEIENRREEADFKDLMNDFDFVKELNRELAEKYADLLTAFPKSEEVQFIIDSYEDNSLMTDDEDKKNRIFQLKRLKSACVALERQDPAIKPPRYEELDNED
jgi:hypothetical protein